MAPTCGIGALMIVYALYSFSVFQCEACKDFVLRDLGCWRDTSKRAIPSIDDRLIGYHGSRPNAIQQCAHAARILGYQVFAVQDGGWCVSGSNATNTYKKYGAYDKCKSDGKGGPWANQVYEIETVIKVIYRPVGCFKDQQSRAIAPIETQFVDLHGNYQSRTDSIKKCAVSAASMGNRVFALQNGGWCASARNAGQTFNKYGPSQDCKVDGKGGPWANAVYEITGVAKISLTRLGCYRDTTNRALPFLERPEVLAGNYQQRPHAIEQCVAYASGLGHNIVGIQNGGSCMAGTNYARYGHSTACKSDSKGGPWANEVFQLSVVNEEIPPPILQTHRYYHLFNLGCWADKQERAIRLSLEASPILVGNYKSRKDAIQRCAQAASVKGFDIIGVQDGGECWSGKYARKTYRRYGVSSSCEGDGEGGTWANQVYEIGKVPNPNFTGIGCYKDTINRAITLIENTQPEITGDYKKRADAVRKCARAAASLGHVVFGVQNGGHCCADDGSTYMKYGRADNCGNGRGGVWSNSVYKILSDLKFSIEDKGCWADDAFRTIPPAEEESPEFFTHTNYKTREDALAKCARHAFSLGFTHFALQDGGWCATSVNAGDTYQRIGPSVKCKPDGKGGPWANQVYAIIRRRQ